MASALGAFRQPAGREPTRFPRTGGIDREGRLGRTRSGWVFGVGSAALISGFEAGLGRV